MTPSNTDFASPRTPPLSGRSVAIIVASLSISITALILALILTSTFVRSWRNTRDQIISAPAIDRNNAVSTARIAARAGQLQANAEARAKLPPPRPLTTIEAGHVVDLAESQLPAKMSPAQIRALTNELQKPGQSLVDPAISISISRSALQKQPPFQVVQVDTGGMGPGKGIRVTTLRCYLSKDDREGTSLNIDLKGNISKISVTSAAERSSMMLHRPAVPLVSNDIPQWQVEEKLYAGFAVVAATELAVAALLFLAGINALRQTQRWVFYHRLYAWTQLSVLIVSALIWFANKSGEALETKSLMIFSAVVAAYPLVLIFTLPSTRITDAVSAA